jgi:hypothetical protein
MDHIYSDEEENLFMKENTRFHDFFNHEDIDDLVRTIHETLNNTIFDSKDSKNYAYRDFAVSMLKSGLNRERTSLTLAGEEILDNLPLWLKSEGFRIIANYCATTNNLNDKALKYYLLALVPWKTIMSSSEKDSREFLDSPSRDPFKLAKSLRKSQFNDLFQQINDFFPPFIEKLPLEEQPVAWLEYIDLQVGLVPKDEILLLLTRTENILNELKKKHSPQEFLSFQSLEISIAVATKNENMLDNSYSRFKSKNSIEKYTPMRNPNLDYAQAYYQIGALPKAKRIFKDQITIYLEKWKSNEKEEWIK